MKNFWLKLKKSAKGGQAIYALAPMAGVTDSAFRQICKGFSADVLYSEMASATALAYNPQKTLEMLKFSKVERPYVVQSFGSNPEHFEIAAKLITSHPLLASPSGRGRNMPDGIDINFGCPVKKIQKQGAGAVLMDNPKLAREIIKSVIDSTSLPVSIKIRSKVGETDALKFLDYMRGLDIKAVMIHGRTLNQGFSGSIDTEVIKKARDYFGGIILANGGVNSYDDAVKILDATKADGIGIARGALGKPWIFEDLRFKNNNSRSKKEIYKIALKHAKLAYELKGRQGIIEMRKHLCWYVQGLPGAKTLRNELVHVTTLKDIKRILK